MLTDMQLTEQDIRPGRTGRLCLRPECYPRLSGRTGLGLVSSARPFCLAADPWILQSGPAGRAYEDRRRSASTRRSHYFDSFYAIMNSTELSRFQRNLSFWSWRNKLCEPPNEANINPIRIKKRKGSFIMVVYQPPVLELPVPIGAYRSVNGFVCIATSVVLVVSRKYLFSGNMVNQKLLCSRFFIHRCRKCSSFPFSYEAGRFIGNRSARSDSSCSNLSRSFVRDGL